jgi:hypothetical protein
MGLSYACCRDLTYSRPRLALPDFESRIAHRPKPLHPRGFFMLHPLC